MVTRPSKSAARIVRPTVYDVDRWAWLAVVKEIIISSLTNSLDVRGTSESRVQSVSLCAFFFAKVRDSA